MKETNEKEIINNFKEWLKETGITKFSQDKQSVFRRLTRENGWEFLTKETVDLLYSRGHQGENFDEALSLEVETKDKSGKRSFRMQDVLPMKQFWETNGYTMFATNNRKLLTGEMHKIDEETKFWCKTNAPVKPEISTQLVDDLLFSVCGGLTENIEYLERWIVTKIYNPKGSSLMPSIIIYGGGGTGKGILQKLIATLLHGHTSVAEMEIANLGKFTDEFLNSSVIFFNESDNLHKQENELKKVIGSEYLTVNVKNQPAFKIANNISFIFTTNSPTGAVTLGQNKGVNRRYGAIKTASVELVGSKDIVKAVQDREVVQNWLSKLIDKHGTLKKIEPHHKTDYDLLIGNQEEGTVQFECKRILMEMGTDVGVTKTTLKNYLRYYDEEILGNRKMKDSKYYTHIIADCLQNVGGVEMYTKGDTGKRIAGKVYKSVIYDKNTSGTLTSVLNEHTIKTVGNEIEIENETVSDFNFN